MFLIGDMNGKVGNERVEGIVGGWGVPATVDENGSALVDICAGRGLAIYMASVEENEWGSE